MADEPPPPPREVLDAARTLEAWVTSEMTKHLRDRDFNHERPSEMLMQLRFFLDVYADGWRASARGDA